VFGKTLRRISIPCSSTALTGKDGKFLEGTSLASRHNIPDRVVRAEAQPVRVWYARCNLNRQAATSQECYGIDLLDMENK
jgi:hypothetical protein